MNISIIRTFRESLRKYLEVFLSMNQNLEKLSTWSTSTELEI